ncbi:MAG: hypothetical protein GVY04_13540 [Cyanobacteria bacterium]|jgi:uncharacterized membrane protein YgcG|nr:hypothetical protein [Cyanobacteria bacterium GSL.Bin1]
MLPKIFASIAFLIAVLTIFASYTQRSALALRQESQPLYLPRHNTGISGYYFGGSWRPTRLRSDYGSFRGGGPSSGK